jgi:hypothetical protein
VKQIRSGRLFVCSICHVEISEPTTPNHAFGTVEKNSMSTGASSGFVMIRITMLLNNKLKFN